MQSTVRTPASARTASNAAVKFEPRSRIMNLTRCACPPRSRPLPLALDLAGMSRSLPIPETAETVPVPGGRLRVLMVISRPAGRRDVGYRMIARPLLERLEAVRGQVDLVVLRPPTLEGLRETQR